MVLLASVRVLSGATGTVDRTTGWYPAGTNLVAVAEPEIYSKFDSWGGDTNGAAITNEQITFSVTNTMIITAFFSEKVTSSSAVPYRWLAHQNPAWTNDFEGWVTNDVDKDGFTTGEEYWSGSDPIDVNSFLHITEIQVSSTNVRLVWMHSQLDTNIPAVFVKSRASMSTGGWAYAEANTPAEGTNTWDTAIQQRGFYGLSVTNMP